MNPGFDKLQLFTKDFLISDPYIFGQNKNVSQGKKETDTPILSIDTGTNFENIRANSIYFNHNLFNFNVNTLGAQVIFNPSKILHPYNLCTDISEVKRVKDIVSKEMGKIGIKLNMDNCSINRIDLAKQQVLDKSIYSYRPAFDFMNGKRVKKVGFETGYRWGNNSHEAQIYDKSVESNLNFKNLNRLEVKFKKTKYIQKNTGLNTFGHVLQMDPNDINGIYNNYLNNSIFQAHKSNQLVLDFNTEVQKLAYYKNSGRNAVLNYLVVSTIDVLISKFGSIDVLYDMMYEVGFNKSQISRQRKQLTELLSTQDTGTTEISINCLINELIQKFAA